MNTTTKHLIKFIVYGFILSAYALSCSPQAQETEREKPAVPTLKSNDINLVKMHKHPFADYQFTENNLSKNSDNLMNDSYYLMKIGNIVGDEIAVDTAKDFYQQAIPKTMTTSISMEQSWYLTLIEQQSDSALSSSLSDTEKTILVDTEKIYLIIDQYSSDVKQVNELTDFSLQLSLAEQMIQKIIQQIQSTELFTELKTQVVAELSNQTKEKLKAPKELAVQLAQMQKLSDIIAILNGYVTTNKTVLTAEDQMSLKNAAQLGMLIDNIDDAKSALSALAMAWSMLDAEERKQNFLTANKDLYDFLRKKDEKEIRCLINENCKGLFDKLILKVGVYPAIKDYGIENVRKTLTDNSLIAVRSVVQKQSALEISTLDDQIKEKIKTSIAEKLTGLKEFKQKFKIIVGEGLANKINMQKLDLFENNDFSDMFQTAFNQAENLNSKNLAMQFIVVEKMLQFMKRGSALTSAPESEDIKTLLKKVEPRFYIQSDQDENENVLTKAKDQAWSLMFYAKMIQQLSDWKITVYDTGITQFVAQDFINDYKSEELNKKLFPKAELVGMALSLAAQTLKQMYTDKSAIYLLDQNNNRISIKEYLQSNYNTTDNIVVHAAVSDLQNGVLVNTTQLADINLTIEAMNLFYNVTNGIENSASESLKDPQLKAEALNARKQIRLVIMTLANFISNQLTDKENKLYSAMNFQTEEKILAQNSADYAHTIDALLIAYNLTGIDIYKFTAIELFFTLNRNFYSADLKFYRESLNQAQVKTSRQHILEILSSVIGLRKYLSITSQIQFDRIFENWYASILM